MESILYPVVRAHKLLTLTAEGKNEWSLLPSEYSNPAVAEKKTLFHPYGLEQGLKKKYWKRKFYEYVRYIPKYEKVIACNSM